MDEILAFTLRDAVFEQLTLLDRLAVEGDERARAALVDTEILRLTAACRALLTEHLPDQYGVCRSCAGRWWQRQRRCSVWSTLHHSLFGDSAYEPGRRGRHLGDRAARQLTAGPRTDVR